MYYYLILQWILTLEFRVLNLKPLLLTRSIEKKEIKK